MKKRISTRILSLLMTLALLVNCCPTVFAAEGGETAASVSIVTPSATELEPGQTLQLEATAEPAGDVEWSSSDEAVATISDSGLVTAVAPGSVTIEARVGEASDTLKLTVTDAAPVSAPEKTEPDEVTDPTGETEPTEPSEETQPTEATDPSEETEPTEATDPTEEADPSEATDPTEATDPSEETEPTEETAPTEETDPTEETEPVEMPYGLTGLPEGYVLTEEALTEKAALTENGVPETAAGLVPGEDYEENRIIVTAASEEDAAVIAEAFSGRLISYGNNVALIELLTATVPEAVAASAEMELPLPAASPNYLSRIEPIPGYPTSSLSAWAPEEQSWNTWVNENMSNPDPALKDPAASPYQWMHDAVDTYSAWGVTTGWSFVKVAVLDSGVQADHPDLSGRVTQININNLGTDDLLGHGTHVAGIIAATMNNGRGGAGIAPYVSILSIRISDSSHSFSDYNIAQGIYAAVNNGADVINMSFGGYFYSSQIQTAINYALSKNVTLVAAMGNDGSNTINYPAAYNGVIGVVATDESNTRAGYSTYGSWADVAAPGSNIYSTYKGSSYAYMSGTSMAAPVVTGIVALYTSLNGYRKTPAEIEKRLESTATKGTGSNLGAGIVNAAKMLSSKPAAPNCWIEDENENIIPYSGQELPCETKLYLDTSNWDDNLYILYTLNGKTPSAKNGQVINGIRYNSEEGIDLAQFAGSTVTIKAAQVNGMGMVGSVLTLKLKIKESNQITSVVVTGPKVLAAGKTGTFTAAVYPLEKADQGVNWSIYSRSNSMAGAKISSTGKLTTPKGLSGSLTIRATSKVSPSKYKDFPVSVQAISPVAKMTLNRTTAKYFINTQFRLSVASMVDAQGYSIDPNLSGVQWVSSNPKVATVDSSGWVTTVAKGTATITCKALDGSGKSAKCTVTVLQPVEQLTISGNWSIAPGFSATFKAAAAPTSANNKSVTWSLANAPAGVTITSSGTVKVASYVAAGKTFYVTATAKDGSGVTASYDVRVVPKCTTIYARAGAYNGMAKGPVTNSSGHVTTVNLFNVDVPDDNNYADNQIQLTGYARNASSQSTMAQWSSSNPSVASVSSSGLVTAHKSGTAKIYLTAMDGSGKKATITVKVTVPASYISITTAIPKAETSSSTPINISTPLSTSDGKSVVLSGYSYLAFGKSAAHKVVFGDTYGKPTSKSVDWRVLVCEMDSEGNLNNVNYWTNVLVGGKKVTISSSGTLTVKSSVKDNWLNIGGEFVAIVYALTKDGTELMDARGYVLIPPTTYMKAEYTTYYGDTNVVGYAYFRSNQWNALSNDNNFGFTATSSNPKVAGVAKIVAVGNNRYRVVLATGKSGTKGSTKITIKATDGSNKSCSFTVKVS